MEKIKGRVRFFFEILFLVGLVFGAWEGMDFFVAFLNCVHGFGLGSDSTLAL